jgi:hypothetical protein
MGEEENRLTEKTEPVGVAKRRLSGEIDTIRKELDSLIGELDRRRHEALDWRAQLRKHPRVAMAMVLVPIAILGAVVGMRVLRARQATEPRRRVPAAPGRLREPAARFLRSSRGARLQARYAETPTMWRRVLGVFVSTLAGVVARQLARKLATTAAARITATPDARPAAA